MVVLRKLGCRRVGRGSGMWEVEWRNLGGAVLRQLGGWGDEEVRGTVSFNEPRQDLVDVFFDHLRFLNAVWLLSQWPSPCVSKTFKRPSAATAATTTPAASVAATPAPPAATVAAGLAHAEPEVTPEPEVVVVSGQFGDVHLVPASPPTLSPTTGLPVKAPDLGGYLLPGAGWVERGRGRGKSKRQQERETGRYRRRGGRESWMN